MVEVTNALKAKVAGNLQRCLTEATGVRLELLDAGGAARTSGAAGQ